MMTDVQPNKRLIKFPCKCGHRFALTPDMAAGVIQCPKCGLLNDVPTLSELDHIADDGTLLLNPAHKRDERDRLARLNKFYNPSHLDERGNEKDLRLSHEDLADVGADITPIDLKDQGRKAAPKYDPVTGELIRALDVGPQPTNFAAGDDPPASQIPVARTAIGYALPRRSLASASIRIPVELFMPQNVIVLIFIFVIHFFNQWAMFAMLGGFFFIVPIVFVLSSLIASHYGNVIEETGPEEMDEVPRPIRGLSFSDDIWRPFVNISIALCLCYAPAMFVFSNAPDRYTAMIGGGALLLAGTFMFPAVILTTVASGTFNNLRPDRVFGVIRAAPGSYLAAVLLWLVSFAAYIFAMTGSLFFLVRMGTPTGTAGIASSPLSHGLIVYPAMMFAVFLAHWFCWHMGLIYRFHHDRFPWVLQRHISTRRQEEAQKAAAVRARRKKPSYVAPKIVGPITPPRANDE
jgi:hypothetical protein